MEQKKHQNTRSYLEYEKLNAQKMFILPGQIFSRRKKKNIKLLTVSKSLWDFEDEFDDEDAFEETND